MIQVFLFSTTIFLLFCSSSSFFASGSPCPLRNCFFLLFLLLFPLFKQELRLLLIALRSLLLLFRRCCSSQYHHRSLLKIGFVYFARCGRFSIQWTFVFATFFFCFLFYFSADRFNRNVYTIPSLFQFLFILQFYFAQYSRFSIRIGNRNSLEQT